MNIDLKNNRTIIQDNEFLITNLSLSNQKRKDERIIDYVADSYSSLPLTTDTIARGYEVTDEEIETINKLNINEMMLLNNDPSIIPINSPDTTYFIAEDGRVFKCVNGYEYFGLNMDTMYWENNQAFMDLFYNSNIKYSELLNFRDYYSKKNILEETHSMKF